MLAAIGLTLLVAVSPVDAAAPAPSATPAETSRLLTDAYPIEITAPFGAALLHWLDSVSNLTGRGFTGGKTMNAHRIDYSEQFGTVTETDVRMLRQYRSARLAHARSCGPRDLDRLNVAFLEAATLDEALERSRLLLDAQAFESLVEAVRYFEPRYRRLWRDGRVGQEFVDRAGRSRKRPELAKFMTRMAEFYGVKARQEPPPRLVVTPVPFGNGTHAQAIGRFLLLEVRPKESLVDQIAPIVHENAHFLFYRIEPARLEALERAARSAGPTGAEAWQLLKEALPTAIAQGVADRRFRGSRWSEKARWYHTEEIDAYAKRIFPLVDHALGNGGLLDAALVTRLVAEY